MRWVSEAEEGKEFGGVGGEMAKGCGDVAVARATDDGKDGIADGRQCLGSSARSHLAAIFIEGDIAHPGEAGLDRPMPAPAPQQAGGIRAVGCEAGDSLPNLRPHPALQRHRPLNAADLTEVGPVEIARERRRALALTHLRAVAVAGVADRLQ